MQSIIDHLESQVICKTLIITACDEDSKNIATFLHKNDYEVGTIWEEFLDDERVPHVRTLIGFECSYTRVLCMSYNAFIEFQIDVEKYAVDNTTLVFYNLEDDILYNCIKWMRDSASRGFKIDKKTSVIIRN